MGLLVALVTSANSLSTGGNMRALLVLAFLASASAAFAEEAPATSFDLNRFKGFESKLPLVEMRSAVVIPHVVLPVLLGPNCPAIQKQASNEAGVYPLGKLPPAQLDSAGSRAPEACLFLAR
jgi:hypothetical protein